MLTKATTRLHLILKLSKALKIEDTEPTVEDTMLLLETMVHNDVIYLYDQKTNDFICQAKTLEELAKL